jgi:nucleotide-binding universal stress UspA family protein
MIRAGVSRRGSQLPVAGEVIEGGPADVLATAGRSADLLVLGSHGRSRIRHTVLEPVNEACIRKATCPVVVVPVPVERTQPETEPALRR